MTKQYESFEELVAETLDLQKVYLDQHPGAQSALDQAGAAIFQDLVENFSVDLRDKETARVALSVAMYIFNVVRSSAGVTPDLDRVQLHHVVGVFKHFGNVANGFATQVVSLHRDLVEGAA